MSSPDPSTRKRIGRGVPNLDYAVWDREKQNAVLDGNCAEFMHAKFTQNPAMKHHFFSTGNKRLAKASPLGPVWETGLRAGDPRANDPRQWRGNICSMRHFLPLAKQFAKVKPGWHTRPPLAGSTLLPGMLESTKIRPHRSRSHWPRPALAKVLPWSFRRFFSDAPADQSQDGLEIASGVGPGLTLSEHGPCLVGGTVTLDDISFTTKIAIHSGEEAIAPYWCVDLLDTGSPQTFIRHDVLDRMFLVGATSVACEWPCSPRS